MVWFKIDDGWRNHPKVADLSMAARGLWATCGNYCAEQLTDGHITRRQVRKEGGTPAQIRQLIDNRMWIVCESHHDCIVFHDWNDQQPSRDSVLRAREAEREKKRKWREQKAATSGNSDTSTGDTPVDSLGESPVTPRAGARRPDPTRPDPRTTYVGSAADGNVPSARGNADTFSDGTPIPADPGPEPATHGANALAPVVALHPPAAVETGTRPKPPEPTQAARAVVRQVIPGLTRQVIDQLAVHLTKAARDDVPDAAIRAGLERWRDDPGKPNPGALPYRIGDAARELAAQPAARPPSTSDRKFAAAQALKRPEWGDPTDHQELEP